MLDPQPETHEITIDHRTDGFVGVTVRYNYSCKVPEHSEQHKMQTMLYVRKRDVAELMEKLSEYARNNC